MAPRTDHAGSFWKQGFFRALIWSGDGSRTNVNEQAIIIAYVYQPTMMISLCRASQNDILAFITRPQNQTQTGNKTFQVRKINSGQPSGRNIGKKGHHLKSPRGDRRLLPTQISSQISIEVLDNKNPYELGYTYQDIINFRRNQIYTSKTTSKVSVKWPVTSK